MSLRIRPVFVKDDLTPGIRALLEQPREVLQKLDTEQATVRGLVFLQGKAKKLATTAKNKFLGTFEENITHEVTKNEQGKTEGRVYSGKGGKDTPHAPFVEFDKKKVSRRMPAKFWVGVFQRWVLLKGADVGMDVSPGTFTRPDGSVAIYKTREARAAAIAVGIGRRKEAGPTKGKHIFRDTAEKDGPRANELAFEDLLEQLQLPELV